MSKVILALDLSLSSTGFAVGKVEQGKIDLIKKGHINNKKHAKKSQAYRLHRIASVLKDVFRSHPVDIVVKERGFSKGHVSTQALFKVAGVADLMSFSFGHDNMAELTPAQVKKAVTKNGKASKEEVAEALEKYVGKQEYSNDDESDAVAVLVAYSLKEGLL
ncbi:crossover junction endodeoxyribonuclease RuvC [Priestia aryabhattai]|uniref:crossover junction endodeoxyribonuclease RuvC n=1 Tax=Priestia aryabhattai TaxID=412384 RepID=UPI002041E1DB|nr:crossover junction endodeoxyribonuclease RuvC [Priestia aryabhattai]MCM3639677.1 crossover junction endodeoxyribonuclease RuvC [Priestia aryabhattai]